MFNPIKTAVILLLLIALTKGYPYPLADTSAAAAAAASPGGFQRINPHVSFQIDSSFNHFNQRWLNYKKGILIERMRNPGVKRSAMLINKFMRDLQRPESDLDYVPLDTSENDVEDAASKRKFSRCYLNMASCFL